MRFTRSFLLIAAIVFILLPSIPVSAQSSGPVYIVQEGDTLTSIALRFGITPEALMAANNMNNSSILSIGAHLVIPGLSGISGTLTTQVLEFGSSLISLSRRNQQNMVSLVKLNRTTSPAQFYAGRKMIIAVDDTRPSLNSIPPLSMGQTLLEKAVQAKENPWMLQYQNHLQGSWEALPGEILFANSETSAALSLLPGIKNISINKLPFVQGETFSIIVQPEQSMSITATIQDNPLTFFENKPGEWVSFSGIHAMADTGAFSLNLDITLADGSAYNFEQWALVTPGFYTNDAEIYVEAKYLDPEAIAQEDGVIHKIVSQKSPVKLWQGQWRSPMDDPLCVVGEYGNRRSYNEGLLLYYHTGVDFGVCVQNLNIYAPAHGTVVFADALFVRGNTVILDHGWGVYSMYLHMSEISVSVGQMVEPYQLLGLVGNTGRSAGPHLHFEIIVNGISVHPLTWLYNEFP